MHEVVIGDNKKKTATEEGNGDPQGAVISPMLFYIVMEGLAYELKINGLRFAISV